MRNNCRIFNKLLSNIEPYPRLITYLQYMSRTNNHNEIFLCNQPLLWQNFRLACDFSEFNQKLNFYPTCKDFHN